MPNTKEHEQLRVGEAVKIMIVYKQYDTYDCRKKTIDNDTYKDEPISYSKHDKGNMDHRRSGAIRGVCTSHVVYAAQRVSSRKGAR